MSFSERELQVHPQVELRPWPVRIGPMEQDLMETLHRQEQDLRRGYEKLEELRSTAREEGYREGKDQAFREFLRLWTERLEAWEQVLSADRETISRNLPALAASLAARALGRELSLDPAALADMTRTLLGDSVAMETVTLVHAPADEGRFEFLRVDVAARFPHVVFRLQARTDVPVGQVVIETASFRLDGRLSAWEAVWREHLERFSHECG